MASWSNRSPMMSPPMLPPDKVTVTRPGGLTLVAGRQRRPNARRPRRGRSSTSSEWRKNSKADFFNRRDELVDADVHGGRRSGKTAARIDLARFYMARGMYPRSQGGSRSGAVRADARKGRSGPADRAFGREFADGLSGAGTAGPRQSGDRHPTTIHSSGRRWRCARQGKWAEAREKFKNVEFAITSLPIDLQRIVMPMRCAPRSRSGIIPAPPSARSDLDVIGISPRDEAGVAVLRGRLAEALGHEKDALDEYQVAVTRRTVRRRPKASCSRSRCGRSATRSARTMRCANSRRFR